LAQNKVKKEWGEGKKNGVLAREIKGTWTPGRSERFRMVRLGL